MTVEIQFLNFEHIDEHWRRSEFLCPAAGHTCKCEASLDEIWNVLFIEEHS
jgi:hypothetical protein